MGRQYNFIDQLIQEARSYQSTEQIEHLAGMNSLKNIPLQPLYCSFRQMNLEQLAHYLPKLQGISESLF